MPMPQLDSIVQLKPSAAASPAGTVLATAVGPRLSTAASRSRNDGTSDTITPQDTVRFSAATAATSTVRRHDIDVRPAHALSYEPSRGNRTPNTAATITTGKNGRRYVTTRRFGADAGAEGGEGTGMGAGSRPRRTASAARETLTGVTTAASQEPDGRERHGLPAPPAETIEAPSDRQRPLPRAGPVPS
ncbi:hypothetical protein [Actinomadura sp. 9N215]|uniref:hypothetical protein n=1 Tax=Actinomadura sp. 9N215 TaxID=3375150 RepID=UPI0037982B52